eukprot:tig00000430_g667.t1
MSGTMKRAFVLAVFLAAICVAPTHGSNADLAKACSEAQAVTLQSSSTPMTYTFQTNKADNQGVFNPPNSIDAATTCSEGWFKITPQFTGKIALGTCQSAQNFDTRLVVFPNTVTACPTGSSAVTGVLIADDGCGTGTPGRQGTLSDIAVESGKPFYVAVDGNKASGDGNCYGEFKLSVTVTDGGAPATPGPGVQAVTPQPGPKVNSFASTPGTFQYPDGVPLTISNIAVEGTATATYFVLTTTLQGTVPDQSLCPTSVPSPLTSLCGGTCTTGPAPAGYTFTATYPYGLCPGATYQVSLKACNADGCGAEATNTVTPDAVAVSFAGRKVFKFYTLPIAEADGLCTASGVTGRADCPASIRRAMTASGFVIPVDNAQDAAESSPNVATGSLHKRNRVVGATPNAANSGIWTRLDYNRYLYIGMTSSTPLANGPADDGFVMKVDLNDFSYAYTSSKDAARFGSIVVRDAAGAEVIVFLVGACDITVNVDPTSDDRGVVSPFFKRVLVPRIFTTGNVAYMGKIRCLRVMPNAGQLLTPSDVNTEVVPVVNDALITLRNRINVQNQATAPDGYTVNTNWGAGVKMEIGIIAENRMSFVNGAPSTTLVGGVQYASDLERYKTLYNTLDTSAPAGQNPTNVIWKNSCYKTIDYATADQGLFKNWVFNEGDLSTSDRVADANGRDQGDVAGRCMFRMGTDQTKFKFYAHVNISQIDGLGLARTIRYDIYPVTIDKVLQVASITYQADALTSTSSDVEKVSNTPVTLTPVTPASWVVDPAYLTFEHRAAVQSAAYSTSLNIKLEKVFISSNPAGLSAQELKVTQGSGSSYAAGFATVATSSIWDAANPYGSASWYIDSSSTTPTSGMTTMVKGVLRRDLLSAAPYQIRMVFRASLVGFAPPARRGLLSRARDLLQANPATWQWEVVAQANFAGTRPAGSAAGAVAAGASSAGLTTGAIVGIAVGCGMAAVLGVVIAAVIVARKRRGGGSGAGARPGSADRYRVAPVAPAPATTTTVAVKPSTPPAPSAAPATLAN